jgi:hypothetical protein
MPFLLFGVMSVQFDPPRIIQGTFALRLSAACTIRRCSLDRNIPVLVVRESMIFFWNSREKSKTQGIPACQGGESSSHPRSMTDTDAQIAGVYERVYYMDCISISQLRIAVVTHTSGAMSWPCVGAGAESPTRHRDSTVSSGPQGTHPLSNFKPRSISREKTVRCGQLGRGSIKTPEYDPDP